MPSDEVVITTIATVGTSFGAYLSYLGIKAGVRRARTRRTNEVGEEEREAVDRYESDPSQFVKDVLESNRQYANEVKSYREEVKGLREELTAFKQEDRIFRTALARWVSRILDAWGREPVMPYPEGADAKVLADVIPSALEATRPRIS